MIRIGNLTLTISTVAAVCTMFVSSAHGEYSKRFEANRSASRNRALDRRELVVWKLSEDAPRRDWAPEILKRAKTATSASDWTSNISPTSTSGELWRGSGGSGPRIWNEKNRPTVEDLEPKAYRLAMDILAPVLVLQPGEELVAWMVVHELVATESRTGEKKSGLGASTIKFARVLEGVPVLGADSYVALTFATDGSLSRLVYAWPPLERVAAVQTVEQSTLLTRAGLLHTLRGGRGTRESVDCGYYPAGGGDSYVPVCLIVYRDLLAQQPTSWLDVVPMSETVVPTPEWAESTALTSPSP